ncbi:methionyl-tRNA formyltransferase [Candidatus Woesebacteria bacterium]|nr:methionyl-tRNA formyltransferase [Candidatus Woesebacteria bacterium]
MDIVFFGTPDYVVPVLENLHKKFKDHHGSPIAAVVTQEPKPSGRKKLLKYSAVDDWAHKREKPIFFRSLDLINEGIKADIGILAAYGEIIPQKVIDYFPYGMINIHPSLLPKFRGASPVQATLVSGEDKAGVTIMKMDEQLDHGPIISQFTEDVHDNDTTETLRDRLFLRSAEVLETLIPAYIEGKIHIKKQDHGKATFTKMIKKSDAFIDPKALGAILQGLTYKGNWEIPFMKGHKTHYSPVTIHNFIRAMQPWPQAWTFVRLESSGQAKRLKLLKSHIEEGMLVLDEVQLEGKNPVSWEQFTEAYPNYEFTHEKK